MELIAGIIIAAIAIIYSLIYCRQQRTLCDRELRDKDERHERELRIRDEQLERERNDASRREQAAEQRWEKRIADMRREISGITAEQLAKRQTDLQQTNTRQLDEVLRPVKEQFEAFRKAVDANRTQSEIGKKEIQHTFAEAMRVFELQQKNAVEALREESKRIGNDAANLTRALKGDSKLQGDWGEMILESLLENSGLRRDEEYFIQENVKSEDGTRDFRPDVIVRFPGDRAVIIDSKVSLTAFADACSEPDPDKRSQRIKDHVRSLRKHVDELAAKNYPAKVKDAIEMVLMFVPNDQAYITAITEQHDLCSYAYSRHIVIISPSNLMMSLQLAYQMWQQDKRNRNVEKILDRATALYDKVAGYVDTFNELGTRLSRLDDSYQKARNQLCSGSGNIVGRMKALREMGISPKKKIAGEDDSDDVSQLE